MELLVVSRVVGVMHDEDFEKKNIQLISDYSFQIIHSLFCDLIKT